MEPAHSLAQSNKNSLSEVPLEALNQGSYWRRMLDSHYRSLAFVNPGARVYQITFYAILKTASICQPSGSIK